MLARGPRVALLVYPGTVTFDHVTVHEVFGVDHAEQFGSWYQTRVCAATVGTVPLGDGFSVSATHTFAEVERCDLVVVPGWSRPEPPPHDLVMTLRRAHLRGARVMSVSTGAFVLGWAGLLDGRRVTTHWSALDRLAHLFPKAEVVPAALFVDDGDVLTSAGMWAGIDLALHVVRADYGAEVAAALARRMVVAQRPARHVAPADTDPLPTLLAWMRDHLHEQQPLSELAARVHMSPRTLTRRFLTSTGTTPHQWLIRERVQAVRSMLESTNEPIERIARRTGFPSTANMRQLFRRHVGTAPHDYRVAHRAACAANEAAC